MLRIAVQLKETGKFPKPGGIFSPALRLHLKREENEGRKENEGKQAGRREENKGTEKKNGKGIERRGKLRKI